MLERSSGTWVLWRRAAALLTAGLGGVASAGTVSQAAIVVSPQMQMRTGEVDGCGFQLKSLPVLVSGQKAAVMLDVSLNLYANYLALMKGGAVELSMSGGIPKQGKSLPITSFWLKAVGGKATVPAGNKVIPADTPGYLLYGADFTLVAELFHAVLEGKEFSVGVKVQGEGVERIYVGVPNMEDAERRQSNQCMLELLARMQAVLDAQQRKDQPKQ